ncbi:MAG: hypothetical protein Q9216_005637 [Gyalolechia sp. 2 TL-2023]
MTRIRAQDQANYLGPLFVNPGGPGGSGTDFLFQSAANLVEQVGKGYDIVSWDPRGVGSTLPALSCFPDPESRAVALEQEEHFFLFNNDSTLEDLGAHQQATALGCQKYSGEVLPYIGTMANVRDLNLMNRLYGFSEDLTYLAYSYGAVLGSAYAATFPRNIKRMAVDGVMDANRWFFDKEFLLTSYVDSDKVIDEFFQLCFLAGQQGCTFWHSSYTAIRQAFITIDESLHRAPVAAGPTRQFDWSQFRLYVWNALKSPSTSWNGNGGLDTFLSLLDDRKLSQLTATAADALFKYIAQGNDELSSTNTLVDPDSGLRNGGGASTIIGAVDNPYSFGDIRSILPFLQSERVTRAGYLVQSILGTRGVLNNYIQTPAERPLQQWSNIETSYPLLFVSNLRDPLTPLQEYAPLVSSSSTPLPNQISSAISNSAIFPGSVVLRTNGSGHTTTFSAPNDCAKQAIFDYFNSDSLPDANTLCEPATLAFNLRPQDLQAGAAPASGAVDTERLKRRGRRERQWRQM